MAYVLAVDGDDREKSSWNRFLASSFPSYEAFWVKHVVPLTNRPVDIHFKEDAALLANGKTPEDIAIAQLHYTILKHLLSAFDIKNVPNPDELALLAGLSSLVGAQDVAFEVLERYTNLGTYDPWLEARPRGGPRNSGQDAQANWKRSEGFPLQDIRDYRNKLIHGRTPPAILKAGGLWLPAIAKVNQYCDWRLVTDHLKAANLPVGDFTSCTSILDDSWNRTLDYFETEWQKHLLP